MPEPAEHLELVIRHTACSLVAQELSGHLAPAVADASGIGAAGLLLQPGEFQVADVAALLPEGGQQGCMFVVTRRHRRRLSRIPAGRGNPRERVAARPPSQGLPAVPHPRP